MTTPADMELSFAETRVLGSLVEKEMTTPEYYPLTLPALVAACNQRSNRDPVSDISESEVSAALADLRARRLAYLVQTAGGRVARYRHDVDSALGLEPAEKAVLALLLLRGPQTAAELRTRGERLHFFRDLAETEETLRVLAGRPRPLVLSPEPAPGQRERRHLHLLQDASASTAASSSAIAFGLAPVPAPAAPGLAQRVELLEAEVRRLREEMDSLQRQLGLTPTPSATP